MSLSRITMTRLARSGFPSAESFQGFVEDAHDAIELEEQARCEPAPPVGQTEAVVADLIGRDEIGHFSRSAAHIVNLIVALARAQSHQTRVGLPAGRRLRRRTPRTAAGVAHPFPVGNHLARKTHL